MTIAFLNQLTSYKQRAAERAVEFLQSGQAVGLGEGSTVIFAARRIAQLLSSSQLNDIVCIPASIRMALELKRLGIPTTTLEDYPEIDLTIDGADEVDLQLNLIKGGGGALLREKIVTALPLWRGASRTTHDATIYVNARPPRPGGEVL
jgi:ribose 5-phosphate isomerase A